MRNQKSVIQQMRIIIELLRFLMLFLKFLKVFYFVKCRIKSPDDVDEI